MWGVFKSFFGITDPANELLNHSNNELIIRNPEHENSISDLQDSNDRNFPNMFGVSIFTDPIQMHRYLEKQMDEMLANTFSFRNIPQGMLEDQSAMENPGNLRDEFLKPGYTDKLDKDSDLDGRINSREIENFLDSPKQMNPTFFSRCVTIRSIRKPDGTIETVRTERTNDGNEENTVIYEGSHQPQPFHNSEFSDIDKITKLFF